MLLHGLARFWHLPAGFIRGKMGLVPRQIRIEYPGAIYHLLNQGDRREAIFRDDGDCHDFIKTLGEDCEKTGFEVHALCLMKHHFHLVVETPEGHFVTGMRWLLSTCSTRFNRRHDLCGHVFSGCYKALVVDGASSSFLPGRWQRHTASV
jgi:REP element-mobilizing transposase RayT